MAPSKIPCYNFVYLLSVRRKQKNHAAQNEEYVIFFVIPAFLARIEIEF